MSGAAGEVAWRAVDSDEVLGRSAERAARIAVVGGIGEEPSRAAGSAAWTSAFDVSTAAGELELDGSAEDMSKEG